MMELGVCPAQRGARMSLHLCAGDVVPYQYPVVDVHVPERTIASGSIHYGVYGCF